MYAEEVIRLFCKLAESVRSVDELIRNNDKLMKSLDIEHKQRLNDCKDQVQCFQATCKTVCDDIKQLLDVLFLIKDDVNDVITHTQHMHDAIQNITNDAFKVYLKIKACFSIVLKEWKNKIQHYEIDQTLGFNSPNDQESNAETKAKITKLFYHISSEILKQNIDRLKLCSVHKHSSFLSTKSHSLEETIRNCITQQYSLLSRNRTTDKMPNFDIKLHECKSIKKCRRIRNMVSALSFYSTIDVIKNKDQEKFMKYYKETYQDLLNDYIHIINKHSSELDDILNTMKKSTDFKLVNDCDIFNCALFRRHHRDRENEDIETLQPNSIAIEMLFYIDILDSMHCQLFHLYDAGLKVKISELQQTMSEKKIIEYLRKTIKDKTASLRKLNIKRFGVSRFENNKFNIAGNPNNINPKKLFRDSLQNIKHSSIKNILIILNNEEYDTDAIFEDIQTDGNEDCNIKTFASNSDVFNQIKQHIYHIKLQRYTFFNGYRFYYWPVYKMHKATGLNKPKGALFSIKYQVSVVSELYVETKYDNLKEEILNNQIKKLSTYQFTMALQKAMLYSATDKIKTCFNTYQAKTDDEIWNFSYGIEYGAPVTTSHILSICLYCDWNELCTAFSGTFRKNKWNESIQSVVRRNQEFANMSRLVRETVELYGYCMQKQTVFCGMSYVMAIPQMLMKLNGPTSTTTVIEIANGFAGDDGIVIQLNNLNNRLRSFNTSWITNYPSESEFLFCGGFYPIKIESVIIQSTSENLYEFMRPLYCFHCFLTGKISKEKVNATDYEMLKKLICIKLQKKDMKAECPKYISGSFDAFLLTIKTIEIDLSTNKTFQLLPLMWEFNNSVFDHETIKFVSNTLRLFPNVKTIIINTSKVYIKWKRKYLLYILEEIRKLLSNVQKVIIRIKSKPKEKYITAIFWELMHNTFETDILHINKMLNCTEMVIERKTVIRVN
eukprot:486663_1